MADGGAVSKTPLLDRLPPIESDDFIPAVRAMLDAIYIEAWLADEAEEEARILWGAHGDG